MNKKQLLMIIAVILGLGAFAIYFQSDQLAGDTPEPEAVEVAGATLTEGEFSEKFEKALAIIEEQYVNEVSEDELLQGAIKGMLETLEDPYSVYMSKEEANQFTEALGSHFEGIGAEVMMTDGKVTIVTPMRESPAEQAGLQPNDKILKIDGETIEGLSLSEAVMQIRGEKGTTVTLTIERAGSSELLDIPVVRDAIPIETVHYEMIEKDSLNIGLIQISSFSADTADRFKEALESLESDGMEGLVIDVRGNPGGYLDQVEDIGKLIIPDKQPIVQIQDRNGEKMRVISTLEERKAYPIVGITDKSSASASEILAGALIEGGNYDVVGEQTFGKGTVQQTLALGDGSQLKLSVYRWLTAGGNDINGEGVMPTVEVKQPDYFYAAPLSIEDPLALDTMGEQVRNAQRMLKGIGFDTGREDGYFDEQTVKAVEEFQKSNDLKVTGQIDQETASVIQEVVVENVRDKENDAQFQAALDLIIKQATN